MNENRHEQIIQTQSTAELKQDEGRQNSPTSYLQPVNKTKLSQKSGITFRSKVPLNSVVNSDDSGVPVETMTNSMMASGANLSNIYK